MKAITGGKIYINHEFRENLSVLFDDRIITIVKNENINHGEISSFYDLEGKTLVPGFIDIHIHGFGGFDAMDEDASALDNIACSLPRHGITSFLPTTMTMPLKRIRRALEHIREKRDTSNFGCRVRGARILGAHLEGPFLSSKYCGAQNPDEMMSPDSSIVEEFEDIIKIITIAPEVEGAAEFIERFAKKTCISLGHSDSDFDTAMRAFRLGARSTTHLFNAMTPLHHRRPGLTGAALCCDDAFVELICDGIHIRPELYPLVLKCKGEERILLISDCIRAGGMCEGDYELGGQAVLLKDGACTLEDGTIAGSVLQMGTALKNFIKYARIPLEKAIRMTSYNQACCLGLEHLVGSIAPGLAADFVVLDDELRVVDTFIGGQLQDPTP